jgi:16S rRNA C967 or C1407 C5-methylase (RsmB/RsmF family)
MTDGDKEQDRRLARAVVGGGHAGDRLRALVLELWQRTRLDWGFVTDRLAQAFRRERWLGSTERRFVAETVYGLVRHLRRIDAAIAAGAGRVVAPRDDQRLIAYLVLELGVEPERAGRADRSLDWTRVAAIDAAIAGERRPATRLALACSLPDWLAERLVADWGDDAEALGRGLNQRAPMTIRANLLKTTRDDLAAALDAEGLVTRPGRWAPAALHVETRVNLFGLAAFRRGELEAQDEGSQLLAELVLPSGAASLARRAGSPAGDDAGSPDDPTGTASFGAIHRAVASPSVAKRTGSPARDDAGSPDDPTGTASFGAIHRAVASPSLAKRSIIVDLCAGAGGKTLALAASMANRGRLVACDVDAAKLEELRRCARRAGVSNARTVVVADGGEWPAPLAEVVGRCDRVLVDAPCTGVGALRRNPEARWRLAEADVARLAAQQRALCLRAAELVAPGGSLIYGTCTVLAAENQDVVEAVLAARPELEVVPAPPELAGRDPRFMQVVPHRHGTDGFFGAVLRWRPSR